MAQSYAKYTCWYGFWIKRDEIAADVNKCLPPSCFTTVPDSTLVALLGKVLVHWIQTAAVAPAQLLNTETRTRFLWTRYARILKIGFSGSAGLSSPSGNGATNTRTGRPERPCSIAFPRMIPVQPIGAAKATFWPLWERYANTKAVRPETCQNPTLRRLYNIFQLFLKWNS